MTLEGTLLESTLFTAGMGPDIDAARLKASYVNSAYQARAVFHRVASMGFTNTRIEWEPLILILTLAGDHRGDGNQGGDPGGVGLHRRRHRHQGHGDHQRLPSR